MDRRKKRFRIMVASGENPVVKGSGLSEKALINPSLFFCLNIRRIKASMDVAMTLYDDVQPTEVLRPGEQTDRSECNTIMPVMVSGLINPSWGYKWLMREEGP